MSAAKQYPRARQRALESEHDDIPAPRREIWQGAGAKCDQRAIDPAWQRRMRWLGDFIEIAALSALQPAVIGEILDQNQYGHVATWQG